MSKKKKKLVELFYDKKRIKAIKHNVKKQLLNEGIFEDDDRLTEDDVNLNINKIKEYNKFGKMIYREGNLFEIAKDLYEIAKFAGKYTVENTGDWFDGQTVSRNMKELKSLADNFAKVAKSVQSHQDSMSALYEDMGNVLNRYFEINDLVEEVPTTKTDNYLRTGDRAEVDINKVRAHNPTPKYIRQVRQEISKGKGTVKIFEINNQFAKVSGGDINLIDIKLPINSLRKILPGQRIGEAVKFDSDKMAKFVKGDKFLEPQFKMLRGDKVANLKKLFNTYVLGDLAQEREYNKK